MAALSLADPEAGGMSREITILIEDEDYVTAKRRAADIGHGTKPEHVAADWVKAGAQESRTLNRKFREAARRVDLTLLATAHLGDEERFDRD